MGRSIWWPWKHCLLQETVGFSDALKKNIAQKLSLICTIQLFQPKELCTVQKPIKTDRKLLQQLLNATTGSTLEENLQGGTWSLDWRRLHQVSDTVKENGKEEPIRKFTDRPGSHSYTLCMGYLMPWTKLISSSCQLFRRVVSCFVEKGKGLLERWGIVQAGVPLLRKPWSFRRDDVLRTP